MSCEVFSVVCTNYPHRFCPCPSLMHDFAVIMVNLQSFFVQKAKWIFFGFGCYKFCIHHAFVVRALYHQTFSFGTNDHHGTMGLLRELFKMLKFEIWKTASKNGVYLSISVHMILIPVAYYCFLFLDWKGLEFSTQYYLFLLFDIWLYLFCIHFFLSWFFIPGRYAHFGLSFDCLIENMHK